MPQKVWTPLPLTNWDTDQAFAVVCQILEFAEIHADADLYEKADEASDKIKMVLDGDEEFDHYGPEPRLQAVWEAIEEVPEDLYPIDEVGTAMAWISEHFGV